MAGGHFFQSAVANYNPPSSGPAGFDPESFGDLYYWWDFTDDSTMSFSSGTVISSISNKAARTSGNETLNAVDGTPTFIDSDQGTRFDTSDAISNTAVAGTGGDLDCLFSGVDATVVVVNKLVSIDTSSQFNDQIWGAAGTGMDDLDGTVVQKTGGLSGTKCSTDNSASATYNLIYSIHDYTGADRYVYRTYESAVVQPTIDRAMLAWAVDFSATGYNNIGISRNGQAFCGGAIAGNRQNKTNANRGFKVNARSRSGATFSADQYVSHVLIYNGLLSDSDILDLYNNWNASLS
jgi:hypothetical protein